MVESKNVTFILGMFLLLLVALMVMVPGSEATIYENIEIEIGDHWSKKIEKPGEKDNDKHKYEISVEELDGNNFDVYILESEEYGKYKNDEYFEAAVSMENINSTGMIYWSIGPDNNTHYLVVDNMDNIHADDAYTNGTITVDITMDKMEMDFGYIVIWILGIIAVIVFIIVTIIIIVLWSAKKRREALENVSLELGFSFYAKPKPSPHFSYPYFKLFNIGRSRKGINLITGVFQGIQFVMFDYSYTVQYGRNSRRYTQTVLIAHVDDLDLPRFALGPESFFSKVGKLFGKKDINFKTHKKFSDSYLLRGDDENRIRQVFQIHLLNYFEGISNKINVEAAQDKIMVFRAGKKIESEDFSNHLYEVISTVKMISDAGS